MNVRVINGVLSFEMPTGTDPQVQNGVLFFLVQTAATAMKAVVCCFV